MKHTKKALVLLVALVMSLSLLTATAFAAGTGKIIIENTTSGLEYSVYKVFDATYSGTDAASYTIKTDDAWYSLVTAEDSPFQLSDSSVGTTTDTYTVTIKAGKTGDDVLAWFKTVTKPETATATLTGNGSAIEFTGFDNGYYYVTSGLGAVVTLTNLNNEAEIYDKNQTPSWDNETEEGGKFVLGDDGVTYVTSNTAAIGETLHYKVLVNGAPNYTANGQITEYQIVDNEGQAIYVDFHTMVVKIDGVEISDGWIKGYDNGTGESTTLNTWHKVSDKNHTEGSQSETPAYKWYIENTVEDDQQFTIHIKWIDDETGKPAYPDLSVSTIEITYDAVLRDNASIGKETTNNTNSATLKWLVDNTVTTDPEGEKKVVTTTFGFGVEKKDGTKNTVLQGVEFELRKEGEEDPIQVYPSKSRPGRYYAVNSTNWAKTSDVDMSADPITTLTTNENGRFVVIGLKGGKYILTETKPLDGYNSIEDTVVNLTVPENESDWEDFKGTSAVKTEIKNYKGTVLPETGGIGTKLFVIFGSIAVLGTGLFLVTNKRISKENI